MTTARILAVTVDCRRPDRQVEFADGPALLFQPVPEEKTVKNRLHLDLAPANGDQRAEVERLVMLGAKVLEDPDGDPWIVLAGDPAD